MNYARKIHQKFRNTIKESFSFIQIGAQNKPDNVGTAAYSKYTYNIYELSFLRIFGGWESFLEDSFVFYMTDGRTTRFTPKTYCKNITKKRAVDMLAGTKTFPDWDNPIDVVTFAKLYFKNGKPFLPSLNEVAMQLRHMRKIRNAISHSSLKSKGDFVDLIKGQIADYRNDMSPGEFLSHKLKNSIQTYIEYYTDYLEVASKKIIKI